MWSSQQVFCPVGQQEKAVQLILYETKHENLEGVLRMVTGNKGLFASLLLVMQEGASDPCPETQRVAFWLSLSPRRTGLRKIGHGQGRSFPPSFLSNASLSCLNANTTLSSLSSHNSLSEILYEMKRFNYYHGLSYLKMFSCL